MLGDFNEWMRGLATTLLSEKLNSVDLRDLHAAAADLPGPLSDPASRSHLLRRPLEIVGVELPRTRLSLVASDHLPLVADVRIG